MPIALIVLLAAMAGIMSSNWPDPVMADDTIGTITYTVGQANRTEPESANADLKRVVLPGECFATGKNTSLMLALLGPTYIKLNENTSLEVKDDRTITLARGEAHFNVSKGLKRFRVHTPTGTITVVGTKFDVIASNASTVVTVLEGSVRLTHGTFPNNFKLLEAGEQARMDQDTSITSPRQVDAENLTAWARAIKPDADAMAFFRAKVLPRGPVQEIVAAKEPFIWTVDNRTLESITLKWKQDLAFYEQPCGYEVYVYAVDGHVPIFRGELDSSLFRRNSGTSEYVMRNSGDMKPITGIVVVDLIPDFTQGTREIMFDLPEALFTRE